MTRYSMARSRQDVRQFVPGQELVAFKRLSSHRRRKRGGSKVLPKRRRQNRRTGSKEEKCGWGPNCPLCKAQKKEANLPHQQEPMEGQHHQKPLPKPQARRPDTLNMTKTKQQWEQEMEKLNEKYNFDCFSDSSSILNWMKMNNISTNMGTKC